MSRFVSGKSFAAALVVMCAAVMVIAPAGSAALVAPKAGTPCASQTLDRLTPFTWTGVTGADHYEFYVSADPGFSSDIFNDTSIGHFTTRNTRATVSKTLPNGTYYWRVRAVSATNAGGAWSATCSFTMNWSDQPQPQTPADGGTLTYPHPLLLDWTPANGAKQYRLTVSTSPDLSSPVNGFPVTTTATQFSPPNRLASGDYYWGVTPIDAEGHDGLKSDSFSFTWDWPATDTTLSVTDLDSAPEVFDPQFSWTPIPGASSYQIEINPDGQNWSSGSKICCSDDSVATSYSPTTLLPANTYYWRVRAKDATGNYGPWVVAPNNNVAAVPFTIAYDLPGVLNLNMDDAAGNDVWSPGYTTDTPIVTWNPTPGAASYDVDVVPYESSQCQWGYGAPVAWHSETADAAWTPLGAGFTVATRSRTPATPASRATTARCSRARATACASAPAATRTARTTSCTAPTPSSAVSATRRSRSRTSRPAASAPLRAIRRSTSARATTACRWRRATPGCRCSRGSPSRASRATS